MDRFNNKVAVVTGAGSGIGRATALRLSREGAKVALLDVDTERLRDVETQGESIRVEMDQADEMSVSRAVTSCLDAFGRIDVLVANAGIWDGANFLDVSTAAWDRLMSINLRGTFLVCRDFARAMASSGTGGAVVVTASTNSFLAEPDSAPYNVSKGGLEMLIKSMAVDLAAAGIRVNGIAPGTIRTNIHPSLMSIPDAPGGGYSFPPLRRWGLPEECASGIAYLASDDASYITGATLVVDGGQIALNGSVNE